MLYREKLGWKIGQDLWSSVVPYPHLTGTSPVGVFGTVGSTLAVPSHKQLASVNHQRQKTNPVST